MVISNKRKKGGYIFGFRKSCFNSCFDIVNLFSAVYKLELEDKCPKVQSILFMDGFRKIYINL